MNNMVGRELIIMGAIVSITHLSLGMDVIEGTGKGQKRSFENCLIEKELEPESKRPRIEKSTASMPVDSSSTSNLTTQSFDQLKKSYTFEDGIAALMQMASQLNKPTPNKSPQDFQFHNYEQEEVTDNVHHKALIRAATQKITQSETSKSQIYGRASLICEFCDSQFETENGYELHLNIHFASFGFKWVACKNCHERFRLPRDRDLHNSFVHLKDKTAKEYEKLVHNMKYYCAKCNQWFSLLRTFEDHQQIHYTEKLPQNMTLYNGKKEFKCSHCDQTFRLSKDRDLHNAYTHLNEKAYKLQMKFHCKECNQWFVSKKLFYLHCDIHAVLNQKLDKSPKQSASNQQ